MKSDQHESKYDRVKDDFAPTEDERLNQEQAEEDHSLISNMHK